MVYCSPEYSNSELLAKIVMLKTAKIFRECGFDWGCYPNATSSNQQYWIVALLRGLEKEGKIKRNSEKNFGH